jgi:hypothetical protein
LKIKLTYGNCLFIKKAWVRGMATREEKIQMVRNFAVNKIGDLIEKNYDDDGDIMNFVEELDRLLTVFHAAEVAISETIPSTNAL